MNKIKSRESGIYVILNLVNGRHYVGSAVNFYNRRGVHLAELRKNKHHSSKLQRAYNKYGEDAFRFDSIEIVEDKSKLIEREQFWIDQTLPFYNENRVAGSSLGRKLSEETKRKIAAKKLGKPVVFTDEHRQNLSKAAKGKKKKPLSEERKKQIAEFMKGRKLNERQRQALLEARKTWTLSDEARQRIVRSKLKYVYLVTAPDGTEYRVSNMRQFCRERPEEKLHSCAMVRVAHGLQASHKGWKVRFEDSSNDASMTPIDQPVSLAA